MTSQTIYVMRMWHEQSDNDAWRVTITNTKTHEKLHFASLDKLVVFFKERLEPDEINLSGSHEVRLQH
jgi:hypothetical protein